MTYILTRSQIKDIVERSNIDAFDRKSLLETIDDLEERADCDEPDDCDCEDLEDEIDDLNREIDDLTAENERLEKQVAMSVRIPAYSPHPGSTADDIAHWLEELAKGFEGRAANEAAEVVRWIRQRG